MTDGSYIKNNQVSLQILHKTLWCEYVLVVGVLYFCIGIPRKTTSSTNYLLSNNAEFL